MFPAHLREFSDKEENENNDEKPSCSVRSLLPGDSSAPLQMMFLAFKLYFLPKTHLLPPIWLML